MNVTVPPVTETGPVIDRIFVSALVEARLQVDTPAALDVEQTPYTLFDPLAEKVGITPETGLLFTSFNVIVIVDVEVPLAITPLVPIIVELAATGAPAVNVTVPPVTTTGVTIDKVFVSAVVEARVQFDTPVALEVEQTPYVLLDPVAEKVGVTPGTGLLFASFNVMVIVDVEVPFAVTGVVPLIVDVAAETAPGLTVKLLLNPVIPLLPAIPVAVIVKLPVFVIVTVVLSTPLLNCPVVIGAPTRAPVDVSITLLLLVFPNPVTVLLFASSAVIVMLKAVPAVCEPIGCEPFEEKTNFDSTPGVNVTAAV